MTIINEPGVTLNIIPSAPVISSQPQKVLFVGQKTAAGTATAGVITAVGNTGQENTLFGERSMLAAMIRAARRINAVTMFDAIALDDDGGATAATATVTFAGTATEDGTLFITVGSAKNHRYELTITDADTDAVIATNLAALITADTRIQVTAVAALGVVTLTAENAGLEGNFITLRVEGTSPAGITTTIAGFSGGAVNPSLTTLFDPAATERYQTVIYPTTYTLSTLTDFLDPRWNVSNNLLDGVGITSRVDTYANLITLGTTEESQNIAIFGFKPVAETLWEGSTLIEFPNVISSMFGAVRALRFTTGADLTRYVTVSRGGLDQRGGDALASLPYHNTPFYDLRLMEAGYGWTETEYQSLATAGISTMGNDRSRNLVICGEVRTPYSATNDYIYLEYVDTDSKVREVFYNQFRANFRQFRLTEGQIVPNRNIANRDTITAFVDGVYSLLSGSDFVLTQAGEAARQFFRDNRVVTVDVGAGEVSLSMIVPIVGQLRNITGTIQFVFSVNS